MPMLNISFNPVFDHWIAGYDNDPRIGVYENVDGLPGNLVHQYESMMDYCWFNYGAFPA